MASGIRDMLFRAGHGLKSRFARPHPAPVFVVGIPKAGTTAIAVLLAQATGHAVTIDTLYRLCGPQTFADIVAGRADMPALVRRHAAVFSPAIVKELSMTFSLDPLLARFPEARVAFVLRDPRDHIRSVCNRLGVAGDAASLDEAVEADLPPVWRGILRGELPHVNDGGDYIENLALRWQRVAEIWAARQNSCALLRYEDFLADKAGAVARLARDTGLDPVYDISDRVDVQYQPRGDRSVAWLDFFGPKRLARIEELCADGMAAMGYAS